MGILSTLVGAVIGSGSSSNSPISDSRLFYFSEEQIRNIVSPAKQPTVSESEARLIEDALIKARYDSKLSRKIVKQTLQALKSAGKISESDMGAVINAFDIEMIKKR